MDVLGSRVWWVPCLAELVSQASFEICVPELIGTCRTTLGLTRGMPDVSHWTWHRLCIPMLAFAPASVFVR